MKVLTPTPPKEHPADGLYYVDYRMLCRNGACWGQRQRWLELYGRKRVPITLAVLRQMHDAFNACCSWAITAMHYRRRRGQKPLLTRREYNRYFDTTNFRYDPITDRIAFMNALHSRAKREGLVR